MKKINYKILLNLVVFCLPLYLIKANIFGLPTNVFEIAALLLIFFSLLHKRKIISSELRNLPRSLMFGSALILAGTILSLLFNENKLTGLGILKSWFLIPMLFSFTLYIFTDSISDLKNSLRALFFSTSLVGLTALVYKISGLVTFDNRLSAFYLSPNHLAMYLAPGLIFGAYFLFDAISKKILPSIIFYLFSTALVTVPLFYTYSYGAWIALILSAIIVTVASFPKSKQLLKIIFLASIIFSTLLISQLGTEKLTDAINLSPRSSLSSRATIWLASIRLIQQRPFIGIGPGNFQDSYLSLQSHFPPYLEWAVPQPHNIFLAFWLQAGILGIAGFLIVLFFVLNRLFQLLKHKKNEALASSFLLFFLYTLLHGIIDTTYWKNDLSVIFWSCILFSVFLHKYYLRKKPSCKC
ncbi:MAG: bicarbonate transporter, ICT family protein [uncultured bacterium]|nr:MAG: bicarbonate transporter, ICT family protein [uncultured bacterium]